MSSFSFSHCPPASLPCFSFLKKLMGLFLSYLLFLKPLGCHIHKLCSSLIHCYGRQSNPISWVEREKGESVSVHGRGICHAITKHASLPEFTPLGTSVKKGSSSPVLRGCPGAAGVLAKISPGSHQILSSMKQGAV